jgi:hypothetical protein
MFIGNWLINLFLGLLAFIIVFIGSFGQNLLFTSFLHAGLAFTASYLLGYLFRFLWSVASQDKNSENTFDDACEEENREKEEITDPNERKENNEDKNLSDEEIYNASQYVKELINDEEV